MRYNSEQVIKGIMNYAETEVISKLPTVGKWLVGTVEGIAATKVHDIEQIASNNAIVKMLGIVDDEGMYDIDMLAMHLKESAERYGKAYLDIPLVGNISFSADDIESMRRYIERA